MKLILISIMLALSLFPSCTFERKEDLKTEKLERPDMVLEKGSMRVHTEDEPVILTSDRITYWSIDEYAELGAFTFSQNGRDGKVRMEGSADRGRIDTGTRILTLEGDIRMRDNESGLMLQTEGTLTFDIDNEEVATDGSVVVEYEDGIFRGRGFYADLRKEEYSFVEIEEGRLDT